jgi:hypothetical protein
MGVPRWLVTVLVVVALLVVGYGIYNLTITSAPQATVITLTLSDSTIGKNPDPATVRLNNYARWEAQGGRGGDQVHIQFIPKVKGGANLVSPFDDAGVYDITLGATGSGSRDTASATRPPSDERGQPADAEDWYYRVTWSRDGRSIATDPKVVIIK